MFCFRILLRYGNITSENVERNIKEVKWNNAYTSYTLHHLISDMDCYYHIP